MLTSDVRGEFQGSFTEHRLRTNFIVVHHAAALYAQASGLDDVRAVARYHLSKGWSGIGYHVCLAEETNGGPIRRYIVSDPDLERAHVWGRNGEAIGVSCLTNFTGVPEDKWLNALAEAVRDLSLRYRSAQVVGHTDIALPGHTTACPGPQWKVWQGILRARIAALEPSQPASGAIDAQLPILGTESAFTQAQAIAYLTAPERLAAGGYTAYDLINVIVPRYAEVCLSAGVRFDVAVAQMIHETGALSSFWSRRPQRNPAGIGVNGDAQKTPPTPTDGWAYNTDRHQWERGLSFASWDAAIPAHIYRLLGYAQRPEAMAADVRAAYQVRTQARPLPVAALGSAPQLIHLGAAHNLANVGLPRAKWVAGWAWPGDDYGERIATRIRAIGGY